MVYTHIVPRSVRPKGFTLVELMVTIAIVAVLAGIGVPSMQELIVNNRMEGTANELVAAINYARTEAVTRGVPVTICRSSDLTATSPDCATSGGWDQGWIVFVDKNGNATRDSSDTVLRVGSATKSMKMTGVTANDLDQYVIYIGTGQRRKSDGALPSAGENTITVCKVGYFSRIVGLNAYGRPSLTKSAARATSC